MVQTLRLSIKMVPLNFEEHEAQSVENFFSSSYLALLLEVFYILKACNFFHSII